MPSKPPLILFAMTWYEAQVHLGALDYARERHWTLVGDQHRSYLPRNLAPDGIIASVGNSEKRLKWAQSFGAPLVLVAENACEAEVPCVMPDYGAVGTMAAEFFAGRGFRHFAYVYPHTDQLDIWHQERLEGFEVGVHAAGGAMHRLLRKGSGGRGRRRSEYLAMVRWLTRELAQLPLPLAVFLSQDQDAGIVQEACAESGLAIPEQVAILGVNNDLMECPYAPVPLSSIDPDWYRVGRLAAQLLDRHMAEGIPAEEHLVPPKGIVERQSTSIIAVDDPRVAGAIAYIWNNVERDPTVDEVCAAAQTPRRTLEVLFQRHLSRGIKAEITQSRVRRIQFFLRDTDLPATEIADQLGFSSVHYMYQTFKRHTGMTTRAYREQETKADR